MSSSPSPSVKTLLGERGPCPVCEQFDCEHEFYGDAHYRVGDPMSKHPRNRGRMIPAPHRIIDPDREVVVFGTGQLMTEAEAQQWGVIPPPNENPKKRKGETQAQYEDRMRKLAESRPRKSENREA